MWRFGNVPWVAGLFYGIKPAVAAIVLQAVHRIGSKTLKTPTWMRAGAVGDRAVELRRHRLPEDSVSLGGAGRGAHRLDRFAGGTSAVCIGRGPWRGLGQQPSRL
jgi:hypothetical protein